jgi:hypothetical protein
MNYSPLDTNSEPVELETGDMVAWRNAQGVWFSGVVLQKVPAGELPEMDWAAAEKLRTEIRSPWLIDGMRRRKLFRNKTRSKDSYLVVGCKCDKRLAPLKRVYVARMHHPIPWKMIQLYKAEELAKFREFV